MSTPATAQRTRQNVLAISLLALLSLLGGFLLPLLILWVLTFTNFPAFGNSNFIRSLTTVAQVFFCLTTVAGAIWAYASRLHTQRGDNPHYWSTHFGPGLLSSLSVSGIVTVSLGLPLAATKLYLHGISGDQAFRTEYLTRLTDSPAPYDMAYPNMAPYYPSAWFWFGGRFANLLGIPGWEAFKPWAIISLALMCSLFTAIWCIIIRPELGIIIGMVTALVTTTYGSPEPYAAIVAMALPLTFVLSWHAIRPYRGALTKGRYATGGVAAILGVGACTYTLFTALGAVTLILMALIVTIHRLWVDRRELRQLAGKKVKTPGNTGITPDSVKLRKLRRHIWQPIIRLVVIGLISIAISLIHWGYYLISGLGQPHSRSGSALHYLPSDSATVLLPMFKSDAVGLLCLIGLIWLIVAIRTSRISQALTIGIIAMYLWTLASMSSVLFGVTLLGFRVALPLTLTFAIAGVCGIFDATHRIISVAVRHVVIDATTTLDNDATPLVLAGQTPRYAGTTDADPNTPALVLPDDRLPGPSLFTSIDPDIRRSYSGPNQPIHVRRTARTIQAVIATITFLVGIGFAQDIPTSLTDEIQMAYTDTDGYGVRADRFPAGISSYYPQVNQALLEGASARQGYPAQARDIIILTTEEALLAYYPYWSFQAISPHYANPLGLYEKRNELIEDWALSTSPDDLLRKLQASPFPTPNAFVFRRDGDNYSLLLSEDVYPNQPNVHDYTVSFAANIFHSHCFLVKEIGPLAVVTRTCQTPQEMANA
ncbi:arabinofuranosyltransferase [Lawsonella clevelandensis]|uniref:arabinofuranosyltransferase n=1 Tax=Lawsonella clevelandensis TaxID=1528099 RepID=UPI0006B54451|nr:arabinofuranosyltransferase [Lawsonella clevelandensis]MDU7193908.1 arabinofuranosyltransferase [Lawsonella clevelandensis]